MRVLFLGFTKLRYMPYFYFYLERININDHEIHVINWNRDGLPDISIPKGVISHTFEYLLPDEIPKHRKIYSFLKYRSFIKKIIKSGRFDRIIVLHSLPGMLISQLLINTYRERYIVDYLDYTYEHLFLFKRQLARLVNYSYATFVSSDAYRTFLPKNNKVYTSHNLLSESLNHRNVCSINKDKTIVISFWGLIRHQKINEQIIHRLANDTRFELRYYGREQATANALKNLVIKLGAKNIMFFGEYKPEERYKFAQETSIIHNIYDNHDINTQKAIGNKYYDGFVFGIPQLCMKDSEMGRLVTSFGIGLECDPDLENFADKIYLYYNSINSDSFLQACEERVQAVSRDLNRINTIILSFFTILR